MQVAMVNPRKKSRKSKSRKVSGYRAFVKSQMKPLMKGGLSAPQAMKKIGALWRQGKGKENWGTPTGGSSGWQKRARSVSGSKVSKTYGASYPKWEENKKRRKRRKKSENRYRPKKMENKRKRKYRNPKSESYFVPKSTAGTYTKHVGMAGVKTPYGRKHLAHMSHCLSQGKGMKKCAEEWRGKRSSYGTAAPTRKYGGARRRRAENPRRKKRRNPEMGYGGGFFPTFSRIKHEMFRLLPSRSEFYPTFADIKAHPIYSILGFGVGLVTTSAFGGIGRALGGKNLLMSEVLGVVGNIVGFELPARVIKLFNFRGNNVMAKSIRTGGIIVTALSLIFGIIRIAASVKKSGVKGLGAFELPKLATLKEAIMKPIKTTLTGVGGAAFADVVTSGEKQGYTGQEPMGVSDSFLGADQVYPPSIMDDTGKMPVYADSTLGDPTLVEKIKTLATDLGLGQYELDAYSKQAIAKQPDMFGDELGEAVVPPAYSGGFSKEFVY